MKLYSHWISSCAWRVRIALNFKGLDYDYKSINLLRGDQFIPEFQNLNPMSKVPVLVDEDIVVADSFAILLYLEDKYPQRPLLPRTLPKRAVNYQNFRSHILVQLLKVLTKCTLSAVEKILNLHSGRYATGDEIALGDVFLAPQLGSCKRFNVDLAEFPLLRRLNDAYSELPPFQNAVPEKQPGAPDNVKS